MIELEAECQQHRVEVATLTKENSSLRAELADAVEQLARQSQSNDGSQPSLSAGGAISLLRDENDILVQQVRACMRRREAVRAWYIAVVPHKDVKEN